MSTQHQRIIPSPAVERAFDEMQSNPVTMQGACPQEIECQNCGNTFAPEITETSVCPNCGTNCKASE